MDPDASNIPMATPILTYFDNHNRACTCLAAVTSCLKHPERYVRGAAVEALSIICTRGDRDTVVSLVGLISLCPPDSLPEVADAIQGGDQPSFLVWELSTTTLTVGSKAHHDLI